MPSFALSRQTNPLRRQTYVVPSYRVWKKHGSYPTTKPIVFSARALYIHRFYPLSKVLLKLSLSLKLKILQNILMWPDVRKWLRIVYWLRIFWAINFVTDLEYFSWRCNRESDTQWIRNGSRRWDLDTAFSAVFDTDWIPRGRHVLKLHGREFHIHEL